jgi:uncharacterized membrane protein (UPF0127 family)
MKIFKNKNNYLFFACAIIVLILLGASVWFLVNIKRSSDNFFPRVVRIGEKKYFLEIAKSDVEREKGLGGREDLCAECGMLFVFDRPDRYAFWMKGMRFPLDIIWLSGDKVVFVAHNVEPNFSGIIGPDVLADRVIEINANAVIDLQVGERVEFLR